MKVAKEETLEVGITGKYLQRACDYLMLNKPLVVALLLFTTLTGMIAGSRSLPDLRIMLWTLLGGALSAGGAGAVNQFVDRDLDRLMKRTEQRALPAGRLRPAEGLGYGILSCLAGLLILASLVNPLAAALSLSGMIYYVLIYSVWLKRLTPYNIIIGGGAGAIPTLVGWAAATGKLEWGAGLLFAVVFFWTPPHFWAYALLHQAEYARAEIPMLPVVSGEKNTHRQIFIYTLVLVSLTLLMPWLHVGGSVFFAVALVSGGVFILSAYRLLQEGGNQRASQVFRYSNFYLALLFLGLIVDILISRFSAIH